VNGVAISILHLFGTSKQLLFLSTTWMALSSAVTFLHYRETGLKYILPLCGAATFHFATFLFFLIFGVGGSNKANAKKTK
jgi:hypothetical protein